MKNYNGALPSPPDPRDWHIERCMDMPVGSFSFPKTFKVSWLPDYMDQLYVNSCGPFAFAVILACIWHKHYGEDVRWSTGFTYGNRRMTEYKDEGVIMRDFIKTVTHYGNVKAALWDNNFEVPKAIQVFEAAYPLLSSYAHKLIKGYVRLRTEEEAKAHLMKYDLPLFANTQMRYINPMSKSTAYHAMAITGWIRTGEMKCRNSWGILDCPNPEIEFDNFEEVWGIIPMEETKFTDVSSDRWSAEAIDEAVKDGIVAGFPDGTFAPDQPLTREQIAVIWSRMKRYCEENFEKNL